MLYCINYALYTTVYCHTIFYRNEHLIEYVFYK